VALDEVRPEADELGDVRAAGEMVEDVVFEVAGHGEVRAYAPAAIAFSTPPSS
jgi:hypothetical protein